MIIPTNAMRRCRVPESVLEAALSGCVVEPEHLNSERIKAKFGSYGVDVVDFTNGIRRSSLYSCAQGSADAKRTCRTFAVVKAENVPDGLADVEHDLVMRGGSTGAVFKTHGWRIYKETMYTGTLSVPPGITTIPVLMRIDQETPLAMHVYRLLLNRNEQTLRYATIVEVHHPDYLTLDELERTYVVDTPAPISEREIAELSNLVLGDGQHPAAGRS